MKDEARIPVVEGEQNGRTIYVGVVPAPVMARMFDSGVMKVDVWGPGNSKGYQRTLSETRARRFGRYLGEGKFSPTSILLHVRDPGNGVRISDGKMIVPLPAEGQTVQKPLIYIYDGQHRTYGVSQGLSQGAIDKDTRIDLPITIWVDRETNEDEARFQEADQFYTVNTMAKRVRTDLAHQILLKSREAKDSKITASTEVPIGLTKEELIPFATAITNELASKSSSPLMDKIIRPNVARNTSGLPSQGQFEDSLLDNYLGSGSVITWAAGAGMSVGSVIDLLSNYWSAVLELGSPNDEDPADSFLMKTLGIHALNGALPSIMGRCHLSGVPTKEKFKEILGALPAFSDENFWTAKGEAGEYGGGKKAFKSLAKDLVEALEVAT
jgi:DGQHR domain-containing protein